MKTKIFIGSVVMLVMSLFAVVYAEGGYTFNTNVEQASSSFSILTEFMSLSKLGVVITILFLVIGGVITTGVLFWMRQMQAALFAAGGTVIIGASLTIAAQVLGYLHMPINW